MLPDLCLKPFVWPYDITSYYLALFLETEKNISDNQGLHQQKWQLVYLLMTYQQEPQDQTYACLLQLN